MQHYVCGFLFSADYQQVALIQKTKPAWQAGKLNGIGGKVEPDEPADSAMRREFREETGVDIAHWQPFCTLRGLDEPGGWQVDFYRAAALGEDFAQLRSLTEETVGVFVVAELAVGTHDTVPNLAWLIPMASRFDLRSPTYIIKEVPAEF